MRRNYKWVTAASIIGMLATVSQAVVVLDDPLNGSTIGTRENGTFVGGGGWQVTNQYDTIYWHIGNYSKGAFEYNIRNIGAPCSGGLGFMNELSHMYDWQFGNSDINYGGGYRDGPHKQFIRKQCYEPKVNTLELLWAVEPPGNYMEPDTAPLSWNAANNYLFRTEWENTGGVAITRVYRDGGLLFQGQLTGTWSPGGHSIRIAASPRRADEGSHVGAIFSNVKAHDLFGAVPGAPTITSPASGETSKATVVYVQWNGDSHNMYQLRVNTQDNPDAGIFWDSHQTNSDRNFAWTGTLTNNTTYYAFVRLGTGGGWGAWSAGRSFTVNTAFNPPGPNLVVLKGNTICDSNGPYNPLGATYMAALYFCKFDRNVLNNDLALLSSKEFNYIRILSQVNGGCCDVWDNRGIHPIDYTSPCNCFMPAWPDYTQQLRDLLDIAYDTYGMRTEITIFGGAGAAMPLNSQRQEHIDRVLAAIAGREHKIIHLELANEAYQTGFPDQQGVADQRMWTQYITDRTSLLTAISDSAGTGSVTEELYAGSTADIATEHFSRDQGPDGGWFPVLDAWHFDLLNGVPPGSSNEPIGPGSSVASETDPIKLVMAAAFAWSAAVPMYVFHSSAGVFHHVEFQDMAAVGDYIHLNDLVPRDLSSWVRNDGKESVAAFTSYSNGQANKWWTEVSGATSGAVRHTGNIKGGEFVTMPLGILGGGLELEARRPMQFQVFNPLTGAVAYSLTKNAGDHFTLAQGPRAYIIKGFFLDVPGGGGGFEDSVTVNLGNPDISQGLSHVICCDGNTVPWTIGGRSARANLTEDDNYFYFNVNDGYAFQGNKPNQTFQVDYFDQGTSTLQLEYDSNGPAYKNGPTVTLTNTNTWKTVTWQVTDAYFGNRQNGGSDFRIAYVGVDFYLDVITVSATQSPFGGTARAIPGIIQAEDFDIGGANVAYKDNDTTNNGGLYRTSEQVDIEATTDTGGGHNVGWTDTGEWLEYTVNVATTGDYAIKVRTASAATGGAFSVSMNNANVTGIRSCAGTGGWQTWTTITVPGIFLTAGNTQILRFTIHSGGWNLNHIDFALGGADVVSVDLDSTNIDDGMSLVGNADGDTTAASIGGHNARRNTSTADDFYMYFSVADIYAFQGNKNNAAITIDYYDTGTHDLTLQYDGTPGAYTTGQNIVLTNTNTWKTFTFNVSNAYFGNRQNNGADFRIHTPAVTSYIDTVMVFSSTGPTPPGQASNPSPANGATLVPITSTLSWTAGSGATNRDVRFGTANPPPFVINQTATTYNPGTLAPNTTYFWRIDEKNTAGTTTGVVWSFTTLPLPGVASNPNPATGATLVAITTDPSWTAGSNATSHDVHFGTANPPPFVVNQTGTTYAAPTLNPNTTYFWRINEKNSSGTTTGTVWSFTTLPLPGAASAPNPANGATGVSINVDPSWTAGSNATSHDVRFGTANPPPFVVNQTGTTYDPGTLLANTTYFWRIDEKNSSGTTNGTVWSFTTLPLPGVASAPNPANGATGVATNATVSWTAGSNTTSHDVRFGTANPPPFVVNQTGTTYNPGTLANNTTYFWRIDEKNGSGTTTGTVWSFTTVAGGGGSIPPCYNENFPYANGNLNGNGGWSGSATTQIAMNAQAVRMTGGQGSVDAIKTVNCGDPGTGVIRVGISIFKGTGTSTMWSLWIDDATAKNLGRWYGTASTARGRIGTSSTVTSEQTLLTGWNRLVALINPTANTTQFFLNGNSIGTLSHSSTGAGNAIGRLRFERINANQASGHIVDFDDLVIGNDQSTISNSGFTNDPEGWNVLIWKSGPNADATMSWTSPFGNPTGHMYSQGGGITNNTDSCAREGGEINKAISTAGYGGLVQVQYDLRMETDQTGGTCTGGCTSSVLEGDCADKIAVYYSTSGTAGPWTLLEAVNASSIAQNVWSTRTISCPAGANNQANFAVRFRWQFTYEADGGRLDNVKVLGTP